MAVTGNKKKKTGKGKENHQSDEQTCFRTNPTWKVGQKETVFNPGLAEKQLSIVLSWTRGNCRSSRVSQVESGKCLSSWIGYRLHSQHCVNIVSILCQLCVSIDDNIKKIKIQNLEDYEVGVYRVDISTPRTSYPRSTSDILLIMMIVVIIMTTTMMMMREQRDVMEVGWSAAHQRPLECISGSRYL